MAGLTWETIRLTTSGVCVLFNFILKLERIVQTHRCAPTFETPFAVNLLLNQITVFTLAVELVNLASNWVEPTSGGGFLVNPDYHSD